MKQKAADIVRDKRLWILIIILAIGAYLRLWHIDSLLNFFVEYDEGALSLQARSIAEGLLPYRDFTLVQPPFYYLVLAALYKIFGYSLFCAKYLSVFFSLASIILIYLIGKKLYHTGPALVAAGLFAVSPDMIYIGRRVNQEPLGILLILLAIYCVTLFIIDKRKKALIISGLALGLALATKYLFLPLVLAIPLTLIIYLMGERFWERLKQLAKPSFLFMYILLTAVVFLIFFSIFNALNLNIAIPLLSYGDLPAGSLILALVISFLTFLLTLLILNKQICFREWWQRLGEVIVRREVWYLVSGILLGYFAITGYFWIRFPDEFIYQTILLQNSHTMSFPSITMMFIGTLGTWKYLKIAFITGLASLPIALIILNRKHLTQVDYFIAIATIITVLFCQFIGGVPRYYYSVYPFLLLGLASFIPDDARLISADIKNLAIDIRTKLIVVTSAIIIFLTTSILMIVEDPGYDYGIPRFNTNEQYVYQKAIDYLESVSPNKVYAANPIIIAMSSQLNYNPDVDTFALLSLKGQPAEQFIQDNIDQGADFFVLDYWARNIFTDSDIYESLEQAISKHARLVQRIGSDPVNYINIYQLVPEGETILNGDFGKWAKGEYYMVPSGWLTILLVGEESDGDSATISEDYIDGRHCINIAVEEDGSTDGVRTSTYYRIYQSIPFPENNLVIDIMPTFNFAIEADETKVPKSGIVFTADGRTLTIGFSDAIDTEQFIISEDGNSATVIRPADMGQWIQEAIDLSSYWVRAGWRQPYEINVSFFVLAHYTNPGAYNLYVASVSEEQ